MVCPMRETAKPVEVATEYPYESLYRPWSWILSSLFNIIIFAIIFGILYLLYRSRKTKRFVTYRTVQVPKTSARKTEEEVSAIVTGGNGALGREIIKHLVAKGNYAVLSLDILLPEEKDYVEGVSTYIQADIANDEDLCIAFKGVDIVFHCAGITPFSVRHSKEDYHQVNAVGTENVIKACVERGVKRLVHTSSASVTLSKNPKVTACDADESCLIPTDPLNAYVASKGKGDELVRAANGKGGLRTCVLRPNVFVEAMFALFDENTYAIDSKMYEFSIVPLESVAQAHLLAERKLSDEASASVVSGKAYNICDQNVLLSEFAQFVAAEKKTTVTFVPVALVSFLAWINEMVYRLIGVVAVSECLSVMSVNYKSHTYVSDRARQELGWGPSKPWREVVREMLEAKKQQGNKKED